jgi:translocation and assembly module TamB
MSEPVTPTALARKRLPWRRMLAGVLAVVALAAAAAGWLGWTASGLRTALAVASTLLPGSLEAEGVEGSLVAGFTAQKLRIDLDAVRIDIARLRLVPRSVGVSPPRIALSELAAEQLSVQLKPQPDEHNPPPQTIGLPLDLVIDRLSIAEAHLTQNGAVGTTTLSLRALAARLALGPDGYALDDLRFELGARAAPLQVQGAGRLAAAAPFALSAQAQVNATVAGAVVQIDASAGGSLRALQLAAQLNGNGGSGSVAARADAFGAPALQSLQIDLRDIDPAAWLPQAPHARLRIKADLAPVAGAEFALAGTLHVDNAAPAPLDRGGLPLRSASARLHWTAARAQLTAVDALLAGGRLRGSANLALAEPFDLDAELRLDDLRTAELATTLRPLRIDGQLRAQRQAAALRVTGDLRNRGAPAVVAEGDLTLVDEQLRVQTLRLLLGQGRAELAGSVQLREPGALQLTGRFDRLNPGLLLRDLNGLLNGQLELHGQRQPLQGQLRFNLTDSSLLGQPLAGQGEAELTADGRLRVDGALAIRSARLTATGSLGEQATQLDVRIAVPELRELALPVSGAVQLTARLTGAWPTPALELQVQADKLAYAEQTLDRATLRASYDGGSDGRLALAAELTDHQFKDRPGASLRSARIGVDGRLSAHIVQIDALTGLEQTLRLAAAGGWREARWSGQLTAAQSGAPFAVALREPAALSIGADDLDFGPAAFNLPRARLAAVRLSLAEGRIASSGQLHDWQVGREFTAALTAAGPSPRPTLALRGAWDVKLAAQADGSLTLERESGDLYLPSGESIGLQTLQLKAVLEANRLRAEAALRATRAGEAQASAQAELERAGNGWRLAQQRPLALALHAELSDLSALNLLLSDALRGNLRLAGQLSADLHVNGTPAAPRSEGTLRGEALRIAWIEQGLRLQDGSLRAHLADQLLVLDELRFAGPARITPPDKRVAAAAGVEAGSLTLTGRVDLRELRGTAQLRAQRLPLLQRPDRWVIASGQAEIDIARDALRVAGAATADACYVDVTQPELPRLSNDVIVLGTERGAPTASPLRLTLDLGLDTGPACFLHGRGLDAQLAGALRLRAESLDSLRANGTVQAKDGSYTAFGHRLLLSRARLNFQGSLDNPGIDVLALRNDLPVVVGVTITRTVRDPLIRLYSDPVMSEQETLSWLVLGRPADSDRLDNPVLARAALSLLAGNGEGLPTQLLQQLGIDELTIRSGEVGSPGSLLPRTTVAGSLRTDTMAGAARDIIVVGKRINDAITITYEQALAGAANALLLSYRLTDRLSVVAQAGTNNALNLVYSVAFD